MECTLCGKEHNRLNKTMIEGSVVDVCDNCIKFGEKIVEKV